MWVGKMADVSHNFWRSKMHSTKAAALIQQIHNIIDHGNNAVSCSNREVFEKFSFSGHGDAIGEQVKNF